MARKINDIFENFTIRAKIGTMFLILISLSLANFLFYYMSQKDEYGVLIDAAGRNRMISQRIAYFSEHIANGDSKNTNDRENLSKLIKLYNDIFYCLKNGGKVPGINGDITVLGHYKELKDEFDAIEPIWVEFMSNANEIAAMGGSKNFVFQLLFIRDNVDALLERDDNLSASLVRMSNESKANGNTIFIIFLSINTLVIIIYYLLVNSLIINRLALLVPYFKGISEGDLGEEMNPGYKDEIGDLVLACNEMSFQLNFIVASITLGADKIAQASHDMSVNLQNVSQGANDQAASTEEITSSMEEMSANIDQNTDNSQQTEEISSRSVLQIEKSNDAVVQTMVAMRRISEKVSVITDIAKQTNILSLNAAVEAARAGEHGRGFSVVAAEIRKLAELSQESANEIIRMSDESVEIADASSKLLAQVVPNIQDTAQKVKEVTTSSIEMKGGAHHVNLALQQLNTITQGNAAAAEEMAATAEELSALAKELTETVSFFKPR